LSDAFLGKLDVSDWGTKAWGFLWLEFYGVFKLIDLANNFFSFSESHREKTHLDQDITQQLGGLFGYWIACQKDVVLLGPFFNFSFVLVESLEAVDVDIWDTVGVGFFDVSSISENANLYERKDTLMEL